MNEIPGMRKGCVKIQIQGEQAERFLNLCRNRGICVRNIICTAPDCYTCLISVYAFFQLKPLRQKTNTKIHILEKRGLPFFFYQSKKRKAFFAGIIFCLGLLLYFSTRIWNISVEGNLKNSTPEILRFLEQQGITPGIPKSRIHCADVAAAVRDEYPEVSWVSVSLNGAWLQVMIREGIFQTEVRKSKEDRCDLAAGEEGKIVKMITRTGVPLVKTGDVCKKGDILVSGRIEIRDDSQEVVRYEYVHADADIYIKRSLAYYHETPMEYEKTVYTDRKYHRFSLQIGNWYLGPGKVQEDQWHRFTEYFKLKITDTYILPLTAGRITDRNFRIQKVTRTEKEAKAVAWRSLQLYEEKLMEKGVQISENNVKIEVDHKTCISKGSLDIIQKTGSEVPTEMLEQPAERTAEND